jgi:hypothetical protein
MPTAETDANRKALGVVRALRQSSVGSSGISDKFVLGPWDGLTGSLTKRATTTKGRRTRLTLKVAVALPYRHSRDRSSVLRGV